MTRACLLPVRAAVGEMFDDAEIDDMLARVAARYQRLKRGAASVGANDPALWKEAFESIAVEEARERMIEARLRAASATARVQRESFYAGFAGDEAAALRALLVGDERAGDRRGLSLEAQQKAAAVSEMSAWTQAVEATGQLSRLADPVRAFAPDRAFEDEVAREVARLNGEKRAASADADATAVAKTIVDSQKAMRARLNALGSWIGELPGYISRTRHDAIKISGGFWRGAEWKINDGARAAAKDRWINFVSDRLHGRTFEAVDERALQALDKRLRADNPNASTATIDAMLQREIDTAITAARREWLGIVWTDIVSGYRKTQGVEPDDFDGATPPSSTARSLSARRVLHWKDADAWIAYDRAFGHGSVFQAHLAFLQKGAEAEATMRVMGPSPEGAFRVDRDKLIAQARARGDTGTVKRLRSRLRDVEFDEVTGGASAPENVRTATVGRAIRQWVSMAKLGGMVFSSITDLGGASHALSRAGVAQLKTHGAMFSSITNIADPVARRHAANLAGEGARVMAGDIAAQFAAPDANLGLMFKAQRLFYRVNLFGFWQARMRAGAGAVMTRHLGENATLKWDALDAVTQKSLTRYGIDGPAWELVRGQHVTIDGGRHLAPDAAERVDAAAVVAWSGGKAEAEARRELQLRLQAYITDHVDTAMTEPRARERAMLRLGASPGTAVGEALALIMQFKSFPLTVITRHIGPRVEEAIEGARAGNLKPVGALAHFLTTMTVLGYAAMTAKDIARGITPMTFEGDAEHDGKIFMRAFIQGGGAGIFGDFLFGSYDRFGRSPWAAVTGPAVGEAERLVKILAKLRDGDAGEAGTEALKLGIDNTPFLNLFYTRIALNYLWLYQLQEELSPGYLGRMEKRLEDERDQEFFIPPSEALND